ncbi:MAG: rod shape-determining protein MreC [Nannocystaceae bacterium]
MAVSLRSVRNTSLVLVMLTVPILLLRSASQEPHQLNGFDRSLRRIGGPLEAGVSYSTATVAGVFERWVMQAKLQDENLGLTGENRELRLKMRELLRVEEENRELRRALQLRERVPEDLLSAAIIGYEQSPLVRVVKLKLDRGSSFVQPGMAVLSDAGVIGRIHRTADDFSDVRLITDPRSKLAIEVARTRAPGILEGAEEDLCIAHIIPSDDPVQEGDVIQTSGADEMFPRGHPVGQVIKVEQLVGDQQRVEVVPLVRFDRLNMVWVVLARAPAPDPQAERPPPPIAAHGLQPLR